LAIFISNFNGVSIIPENRWETNEDLQLFTDNSSKGFRIYFNGAFENGTWPESWREYDIIRDTCITILEIFPIVTSIFVWLAELTNKKS
jgi:hypothetical protein